MPDHPPRTRLCRSLSENSVSHGAEVSQENASRGTHSSTEGLDTHTGVQKRTRRVLSDQQHPPTSRTGTMMRRAAIFKHLLLMLSQGHFAPLQQVFTCGLACKQQETRLYQSLHSRWPTCPDSTNRCAESHREIGPNSALLSDQLQIGNSLGSTRRMWANASASTAKSASKLASIQTGEKRTFVTVHIRLPTSRSFIKAPVSCWNLCFVEVMRLAEWSVDF